MSPAGTKFRQRCRMNPSLVNCCTIDWYQEWNTEAMLSVAKVYFQGSDFISEDGQDVDVSTRDEPLTSCLSMVCSRIPIRNVCNLSRWLAVDDSYFFRNYVRRRLPFVSRFTIPSDKRLRISGRR